MLRKYFLAGVVALAPLLVTVAVINWLIDMSDKGIALLPYAYRPEVLFGVDVPGMGVLLALLFILLVGALTTHFIGSQVMRLIDIIMERIPLVRTIHKATRQLLSAIFSDSSKAFQKVVMVQFPQQGRWVIGFVTGEGSMPGHAEGDEHQYVSVFVPSTPLPTTGWLLFVDESEITCLDMTVEEGMKLVLSGGMLPPDKIEAENA
ncbi:MAG: DUF502 domain-containing protein [Mariprofundaceae bacterium]